MIETWIQQFAQWFAALFTPAEWKAFSLLVLVTIAITQLMKIGWRILPIPADRLTYRREIMYLTTTMVGFAFAFPIWPVGLSWWIPGILAGPVSAIAFKAGFYFVKRFAPNFAASFNADRRKLNQGPPGGFARRRKDQQP